MFSAAGAGGAAFCVEMEAFAVAAHPADLAGGVADHQGIVGHVFVDNGAGADKRILADTNAAHDSGVGADGSAFAHVGRQVFVFAIDGAAGVVYVGKHHRGPEEDVVFAGHAFVNRHIILHLHIVAENDAVGYEYVLAEVATFTQSGAGHHVAEVPHFAAFAELGAFVNYCGGVDHCGLWVVGCGLWVVGCGLWVMSYELWFIFC